MESLTLQANAKINLGLQVTGLRADGYHDLRTVMAKVDLADSVEIRAGLAGGRSQQITVTSDDPRLPGGPENLAYRAARRFLDASTRTRDYAYQIHIHIKKRIPPRAGLGGGSSDAATVLLGLERLMPEELRLGESGLLDAALGIGSDVPFFLRGNTCLAEGRGERLTTLSCPRQIHILCAIPSQGLSTRDVYLEYDRVGSSTVPQIDTIVRAISSGCIKQLRGAVNNDLFDAAASLLPEIRRLARAIECYDPLLVSMSGSGACIYGVFESLDDALRVLSKVRGIDYVAWSTVASTLTG